MPALHPVLFITFLLSIDSGDENAVNQSYNAPKKKKTFEWFLFCFLSVKSSMRFAVVALKEIEQVYFSSLA